MLSSSSRIFVKCQRSKVKCQKGFTLLELLVVISVVGILTTVGFYSFSAYSKKQSIDQAANDLKLGIYQAKFNAVSRVKPNECGTNPLNKYNVIPCTNSSNQVVNCSIGSTDLYQLHAYCPPYLTDPLPAKKKSSNIVVSITPLECSNGEFSFFPLKNGTDINSCRIVLSAVDSTLTKTICVDNGGNVSIKEGTVLCP